jgi:MFS family permease
VYFVANAMHGMAASWLMVELTGSSFLAALVQTAVFLPMFVLALPAGVLADTTDRGRLILAALAVQAVSVVVLAALMFCRLGRARHAAAVHLCHRVLHGDAVAGVELGGGRDPAA